jgi:acyl-CoA synthetase (AMP-forming)/AMP-acid ligase II
MLETNLDYQICLFALFILGLAAVLLLPTPDERRLERHQLTHDTTKTRRLP